MQKCLNETLISCFTNHPIILSVIILGSLTILAISLLCNHSFPCPSQVENFLLSFSLSLCLMIGVFIILPALLALIMNVIFRKTNASLVSVV